MYYSTYLFKILNMATKLTIKDLKKLVREEVQRQITEDNNLQEEKKKPSSGLTKKEKSAVVKKAKAGKDIDHAGKNFKEVEKNAKEHGAEDPKAVAAAVMWKNQKRK